MVAPRSPILMSKDYTSDSAGRNHSRTPEGGILTEEFSKTIRQKEKIHCIYLLDCKLSN